MHTRHLIALPGKRSLGKPKSRRENNIKKLFLRNEPVI
jgi:hypothetical protein